MKKSFYIYGLGVTIFDEGEEVDWYCIPLIIKNEDESLTMEDQAVINETVKTMCYRPNVHVDNYWFDIKELDIPNDKLEDKKWINQFLKNIYK